MTIPWIEIEDIGEVDSPLRRAYPETAWQAIFACQVQVPTHQEWVKLRWGFNALALFDEAMARQKLFFESQYSYPDELGMESSDNRTLAIRFINRPEKGLLISILGKIHGRTRDEARDCALAYCREVNATFPYDYVLHPACSQHEFSLFSGIDIFDQGDHPSSVADIKRMEIPANPKSNLLYLQGLWSSGPRAHEQIWRSIAAASTPLLLNISLRSTVLYEEEQLEYARRLKDFSKLKDQPVNEIFITDLKEWEKTLNQRRLAPWKKFFYLQVHLVSSQKLSEHHFRTIGTALTLTNQVPPLPGYQVMFPKPDEVQAWRRTIRNLDFVVSKSFLPIPRLSEVADLEEILEVMHLPYSPPDNGFPDFKFYDHRV